MCVFQKTKQLMSFESGNSSSVLSNLQKQKEKEKLYDLVKLKMDEYNQIIQHAPTGRKSDLEQYAQMASKSTGSVNEASEEDNQSSSDRSRETEINIFEKELEKPLIEMK